MRFWNTWMPRVLLAAAMLLSAPRSSPSQACCSGDFPICDCGAYCEGGSWACGSCTPVILDIAGDGFALTNPANGVWFDLAAKGTKRRIAWTSAGSDDGFLALDRNGNGTIEDGRELFGTATDQPQSSRPNGFLALAVFDKPENGGNADAVIDPKDSVYSTLRVWVDKNHNGTSGPDELFTLPQARVLAIHLRYQVLPFVDGYGNQFRYRAKVMTFTGEQVGKWAYDVFLLSEQAGPAATGRGVRNRSLGRPEAGR